jgi:hypothetical protein
MAKISADDIPEEKLEAVIARLEAEKGQRLEQRVAEGTAVKIPVAVVVDQDVEEAKANALRDANVPEGKAHHFVVHRIRTGVNRHPEYGHYGGSVVMRQPHHTEGRPYASDLYKRPPIPEPTELIVGEPTATWVEVFRPSGSHPGEIAEGHYLIDRGRVYLCDRLGKADPAYSDSAGIDPASKARRLLRGKALRDKPDGLPMIVPGRHGGW